MTRVMRYEVDAKSNPEPIACMGGWCAVRETCQHYQAPAPARDLPIDRLCKAGVTPMYWPIFRETAGTFKPFAHESRQP